MACAHLPTQQKHSPMQYIVALLFPSCLCAFLTLYSELEYFCRGAWRAPTTPTQQKTVSPIPFFIFAPMRLCVTLFQLSNFSHQGSNKYFFSPFLTPPYKKEQMLTNLFTITYLPHTTLFISQPITRKPSLTMITTLHITTRHKIAEFSGKDCNFRRTSSKDCNFLQSPTTTKTPVSSTFHPHSTTPNLVLNRKYPFPA